MLAGEVLPRYAVIHGVSEGALAPLTHPIPGGVVVHRVVLVRQIIVQRVTRHRGSPSFRHHQGVQESDPVHARQWCGRV
jgi:hypothetical protein